MKQTSTAPQPPNPAAASNGNPARPRFPTIGTAPPKGTATGPTGPGNGTATATA